MSFLFVSEIRIKMADLEGLDFNINISGNDYDQELKSLKDSHVMNTLSAANVTSLSSEQVATTQASVN